VCAIDWENAATVAARLVSVGSGSGAPMIGGGGCTVDGHAAARSALSVRLSMVQIPSIPGRHSALWRDHATSADSMVVYPVLSTERLLDDGQPARRVEPIQVPLRLNNGQY
jgi:hypothetical protein